MTQRVAIVLVVIAVSLLAAFSVFMYHNVMNVGAGNSPGLREDQTAQRIQELTEKLNTCIEQKDAIEAREHQ